MAANEDPVTVVQTALKEFREANDKLLKDKADGKAVSDLEAKLDKINGVFDKFEPMNQQVTLAVAQQKAMQEQLDNVEKLLNRPGALGGDVAKDEEKKVRAAFDRVMRKPGQDRDPKDVDLVRRHMAALITTDDSGAGYLLAPPDMQRDIVKDIVEFTPLRALATVRMIGVQSYKFRRKTGNGAATRVGETQARSNTGDPAYGMGEILAPELFARMEVSQQMLEDADYDLMAELREDAAQQFAVKEGAEYINGTGTGTLQAEGLLVNSSIGEVNSGSAAAITADGMISLFYGVKGPYARNGYFGLNRTSLGQVRKLKEAGSSGQYLWVPGLAGNVPNTILGAPYAEMPDLPDAGANTYPVLFGDFKRGYVIVDRVGISFQVDFTTGADDGLVVFRARKRTGGGVRQAEAIKKLKCST